MENALPYMPIFLQLVALDNHIVLSHSPKVYAEKIAVGHPDSCSGPSNWAHGHSHF